jgi:quinohemoprotein ethanol dehydrogenase
MISVMKPKTDLLLILIAITLISGCKPSGRGSIEQIKKATSAVDNKRLVNADNTPGDWLSYGRNYAEDRYSTLEQITKDNINNLGLVWSLSIGTTLNGIETTPIVVDGIMYFTGPWSKVYAVNAVTGQLIWTYDPKVPGRYGEKPLLRCCKQGRSLIQRKSICRNHRWAIDFS